MDENSIKTVDSILKRLGRYNKFSRKFFFDLIIQRKKLEKYFASEVVKVENGYRYKNYLLTDNRFEPSVFYYKHGLNEIDNVEMLKNKDVIDVGGYIGDSAIFLKDYTNKNVYSFEPVSKNYNVLLKNLELNKCTNVVPVKKGLGSKEDSCLINVSQSASQIIRDKNNAVTEQELEEINTTTLDNYVSENNLSVGLIKVDIEGFEQEFLKGAENTIKTQKPVLLLSIYHNADDFFNIKPLIESWNLGYKFKIFKPFDGNIVEETLLIAYQLE